MYVMYDKANPNHFVEISDINIPARETFFLYWSHMHNIVIYHHYMSIYTPCAITDGNCSGGVADKAFIKHIFWQCVL